MAAKVWKYTDSIIYHVECSEDHHVVSTDRRGKWICSCGGSKEAHCADIETVCLAILTDSVEDRGPEPTGRKEKNETLSF